jgi:hypothetical protein
LHQLRPNNGSALNNVPSSADHWQATAARPSGNDDAPRPMRLQRRHEIPHIAREHVGAFQHRKMPAALVLAPQPDIAA